MVAVASENARDVIWAIDGKKEERRWFTPPGWRVYAELTPGEHTLTVWCLYSGTYTIKFTAELGHRYLIKDDLKGNDNSGNEFWGLLPPSFRPVAARHEHLARRAWIVDVQSNKQTGEVLTSEREPVRDDTSFSLPNFFSWSPPQNKKEMVLSRNVGGFTVHWSRPSSRTDFTLGGGEPEDYFVSIRVYDLPELKSADEFTEYVRTARQKFYSGDIRTHFRDSKDAVMTLTSHADFCVRYHHELLTKIVYPPSPANPIDPELLLSRPDIPLEPNTLLESSGYNCRIATNQKFGIDFEYAHQSRNQDEDLTMAEQAEQYFGQLKF